MRLDRRAFLGASAASLLARAADRPIIDTHTHFYDPTRPGGVPWPPKNDALLYQSYLPARYSRIAQPLGVRGTVVVEASPWLEDNQWVLDLARNHPIVVGVVGHLDPGQPGFAANLRRFSANPLFRGIRLSEKTIAEGLSRPAFIDDLQRLADADLALDSIGGAGLFARLLSLSDRVPALRIIIDHLPFDTAGEKTAFREAARRPRIYAKVSGVLRQVDGRVPVSVDFYRRDLDEVCNAFGAERVVYASNWPVSERLTPYPTVLQIVRDYFEARGGEAADRYFYRNSQAFYKWIQR